jgi:DUF4097 and DUF4098 domain-containing protein YvlB
MKRVAIPVVLVAVILLGCNLKVNKSIYIEDGARIGSSQNTVNGSVHIGSDCVVDGSCRSVNGVIEVGDGSEVSDLQAVNGYIELDRSVIVRGDVETVNGPIRSARGVEVRGDLSSVNGDIDLDRTVVERKVTTYNGDILLTDRSVVRGDVVVKRNRGRSHRRRPLIIEITEDSVVEGDVVVKDPDIEVKVILSDGGRVEGRVRNAELVER